MRQYKTSSMMYIFTSAFIGFNISLFVEIYTKNKMINNQINKKNIKHSKNNTTQDNEIQIKHDCEELYNKFKSNNSVHNIDKFNC